MKRKPDFSTTPERVTDIQIEHVFQAICADHGVIDQHRDYRTVLMSRREHFFEVHKIRPGETR